MTTRPACCATAPWWRCCPMWTSSRCAWMFRRSVFIEAAQEQQLCCPMWTFSRCVWMFGVYCQRIAIVLSYVDFFQVGCRALYSLVVAAAGI